MFKDCEQLALLTRSPQRDTVIHCLHFHTLNSTKQKSTVVGGETLSWLCGVRCGIYLSQNGEIFNFQHVCQTDQILPSEASFRCEVQCTKVAWGQQLQITRTGFESVSKKRLGLLHPASKNHMKIISCIKAVLVTSVCSLHILRAGVLQLEFLLCKIKIWGLSKLYSSDVFLQGCWMSFSMEGCWMSFSMEEISSQRKLLDLHQ